MNSLKSMVEKEDEVNVITSIYVNLIYSFTTQPHPKNLQKTIMYIHRVEESLSALELSHRRLIENDFIDRSHPLWWRSIYTCNNYLIMRYKAVGSFLVHFYGS